MFTVHLLDSLIGNRQFSLRPIFLQRKILVARLKIGFKLNKLQDTDITAVGILAFLSLTVGLVIGIVSSVQLHISREYVPSWVLLIVIASFVLISKQYLILKHLRVLGMGLALFMIISFVYLSNAIGNDSQSG